MNQKEEKKDFDIIFANSRITIFGDITAIILIPLLASIVFTVLEMFTLMTISVIFTAIIFLLDQKNNTFATMFNTFFYFFKKRFI
jgi:hypothetical protein